MLKSLFDKRAVIASIFLWCALTFSGIQQLFFESGNLSVEVWMKALHLMVLYFLFLIGVRSFDNRKQPVVKQGIIIFSVFLTVALVVLFFVWPGMWSHDDIGVLYDAKHYSLNAWQHYLTSVVLILGLLTFPFSAGALIFQVIIVAIIVGYCISSFVFTFLPYVTRKKVVAIAMTVGCMLAPNLEYLLSGFRMGLYSYVELLLFIELLLLFKTKELSWIKIVEFILLVSIVSSWRSEAVYYLVCIPILLLFFIKQVGWIKYFAIVVLSIFLSTSISNTNQKFSGNNSYNLTATLQSIPYLIRTGVEHGDSEEISAIGKVVSIEYTLEHPELRGEDLYWSGEWINPDYSDEDLSGYMRSYIKLASKYPLTIFKPMIKLFIQTTGIIVDENGNSMLRTAGHKSIWQMTEEAASFAGHNYQAVDSCFKMPIVPLRVREKIILNVMSCEDWNCEVLPQYFVIWNLWIPLFFLFCGCAYCLKNKWWYILLVLFTVLARVPLLVLTASAPYFMYYLSVYLIGWVVGIFGICLFFINRNKWSCVKI